MEGIAVETITSISPTTQLHDHVRKVAPLFVQALDSEGSRDWTLLYEELDAIGDEQCSVIEHDAQTQHYLQRVYCYAQLYAQPDIINEMQRYFPSTMTQIIRGALSSSIYQKLTSPTSSQATKRTPTKHKKVTSHHSGTYSPRLSVPQTFVGAEVSTNEIENAASSVANDVLTFHRNLEHIDPSWPFSIATSPLPSDTSPPKAVYQRHRLEPVYDQIDGTASHKASAESSSIKSKKKSLCLKTGYDVVNGFAQGRLKQHELIYLNHCPTDDRYFNPYNLVVVLPYKVQPDHYIASRFGFFNIHADGSTDPIPFSIWCRDAAMFTTLRRIPFFKNYLIRKMLVRWRANARLNQFICVHRTIERIQLQYFPGVPQALLQICNLGQELRSLKFYSFKPLKKYSLEEMKQCLDSSHSMAEHYLRRFFRYSHRTVSAVVDSTYQRVTSLETELRHQPAVYEVMSPMSVEVTNRARIEQDLEQARYRVSRMGELTILVDQMLHHCLLQLAKENSTHYLNLLLQHNDDDLIDDDQSTSNFSAASSTVSSSVGGRPGSSVSCASAALDDVPDALLLAKFDFNQQGVLSVVPPVEDMIDTLVTSLHNIINVISSTSTHVNKTTPTKLACSASNTLNTLKVKGQAVQLRVSPLLRDNFRDLLQNDDQLAMDLSQLEEVTCSVSEEIGNFCHRQSWLNKVKLFIDSYSNTDIEDYLTPKKFKETMQNLRTWLCDLRALPEYRLCKYSLMCINMKNVVTRLTPLLDHISSTLTSAADNKITSVGDQLQLDITQYNNALVEKRYDLEGFAGYSWQIRTTKQFITTANPLVQFVQQMSDVMICLELCGDEEYCKQVVNLWNTFTITFQQAKEFVSSQTPLKAQGLEENIRSNEQEGMKLFDIINSGEYIDPLSDPHLIISQAKEVQDRMYIIRSHLLGLNKWKEAITGQPHDMSLLSKLTNGVDTRLELWKYRRVYDSVLRDWLNCPFKQLDVSHVAKKISEWIRAANELQQQLPADDQVVDDWITKLVNFQGRIPLLQCLTAKAIKTFHWQSIFSVLGQHYNPNNLFTLGDLLLYNIDGHAALLREICSSAVEEHQLQQDLAKIQAGWDAAVIKITRFSGDKFPFAIKPTSRSGSRSRPRATFLIGGIIRTSHAFHQLLKVDNCDQLNVMIEDHMIQLQSLLSLPYVTSFRGQVEAWIISLTQLLELVSMLASCQAMWLQLLDQFRLIDASIHQSCGVDQLQLATTRLQEVYDSITDDPRAMSLLAKKRGQKGFRELQGEALRVSLDSTYKLMEGVVKAISDQLSNAWSVCPRLYYITTEEALPLLCVSTNTVKLLPTISKMYSIVSVKQLDIISHMDDKAEEGVQLVMVEGLYKEEIELVSPLPISKKPVYQWLAGLHRALQFSIACNLRECIAATPTGIFSNDSSTNVLDDLLVWLKQYSVQCLLLALEVKWCSVVSSAITAGMESVRTSMERCIQAVSSAIRQGHHNNTRLFIVTSNIIIMLRNKLELMRGQFDGGLDGWQWQSTVRYSVDKDRGQQDAIEVQKCSFTTLSDDSIKSVRGKVSVYPAYCMVETVQCSSWYDYEYCCPTELLVTGNNERSLTKLLLSLHHYYTGLVYGPVGAGKSETVRQVSMLLGRHYYWHQFHSDVSMSVIKYLLIAAVSTGSILLCAGLSKLSADNLLTMADMLKTIRQQFSTACLNKNVLAANTSSRSNNESRKSNRSMATTPGSGAGRSHSRSSGLSDKASRSKKKLDWFSEADPFNSHITCTVAGLSLHASSAFRCVLESTTGRSDLPALLIEQVRPVRLAQPDTNLILEVLLLSEGFVHAKLLSNRTCQLWTMMTNQAGAGAIATDMCSLRRIVKQASCLLQQQQQHKGDNDEQLLAEEGYLLQAVWGHFDSRLVQPHRDRLNDILQAHYPNSFPRLVVKDEKDLKEAIEAEITARHLQCTPSFVNKVLQLHHSLSANKLVILVGPSYSGKTTCYHILIAAYHKLSYPPVHCVPVNMSAYSFEQLFGCGKGSDQPTVNHDQANDQASDQDQGMIYQLLSQVTSRAAGNSSQYWLVCDGPLEYHKMEVVAELLTGDGSLSLNNGHKLSPTGSCRLLMETDSMNHLPPSVTGRCGIVHVEGSVVGWRSLVDSWLEQAPTRHSLGSICVEALSELILQLVPTGSQFITQHNNSSSNSGVTIKLVVTLLAILSAQLKKIAPVVDRPSQFTASSSRCFSRESLSSSTYSMHNLESGSLQMTASSQLADRSSASIRSSEASDHEDDDDLVSVDLEAETRRNLQQQMTHIFIYGYAWSLAAHSSIQCLPLLNEFVRDQVQQVTLPVELPDGPVLDLYLNLKDFTFSLWTSREKDPRNMDYIPTAEVDKYAHLIDLLVSSGNHVLLVGEEGSGKTSMIKHLVQPRLQSVARIPVNSSTTTSDLQELLIQKSHQMLRFSLNKQVGSSRKTGSSRYVIFLDDIHTGNKRCQQLVYQVLSQQTMMDPQRSYYQHPLYNTSIIASHTPHHSLDHRLTAKMCTVPIYPITDKTIHKIFYKSTKLWLHQFPDGTIEDTSLLANAMATATVGIHSNIVRRLKRSLSQPYHLFTIKDLMCVHRGLLQMSTAVEGSSTTLQEQFVHRYHSRRMSGGGAKDKTSAQKGKKQPHSLSLIRGMRSMQHLRVPTDHSTMRAVLRLWCHEVTRVYADRLDNSRDRIWFLKLLETISKYSYCASDPNTMATGQSMRPGRARAAAASHGHNTIQQMDIDIVKELLSNDKQLLPVDQLTMKGEDLTGLMFAQLDSSYSELGDGQVMDYLNNAIVEHDEHCSCSDDRLDLILFRRAIEHVTRLCRVLRPGGGHTLLIGNRGTGKSSLTKLAAYVKHCELVELPTSQSVRQLLRDVCITTGIEAKPVVLLVDQSSEHLQVVVELMSEGILHGLFTPSELLVMNSRRLDSANRMVKKKARTADAAYQQLAECVMEHLHVVVCWSLPDNDMALPDLLTNGCMFKPIYKACSYVDLYEQWSKDSYLDVAVRWLKEQSIPSWTEWIDSASQLEAVGSLAVHVHLTSSKVAGRSLSASVISPRTFLECLSMSRSIALHVRDKERISLSSYQQALDKLSELEEDIRRLEQNIAVLQPQLDTTQAECEAIMADINTEKQQYMEANARCKGAESTINSESMNVKQLQSTVDEEFSKVAPVYKRALEALSNVSGNDVIEMAGYASPPEQVISVANCLSVLFDRPSTWTDCKLLLLSKHFLKSLQFFDRDNLSKSKLKFLRKTIKQLPETLDPVVVSQASQAVVSICQWIQALVAYHNVKETMEPYRNKLSVAEDILMKAHETFVAMKKDMLKIKDSLELKVKDHKELVRKARNIEQEIEAEQTKLDKSRGLQKALSGHKLHWQKMAKQTQDNISTAAADCLLMAGSACYLCVQDPNSITELYDNWVSYCKGLLELGQESWPATTERGHERIKIRDNCTPVEMLASPTERAFWTKEDSFAGPVMCKQLLSARIAAIYYNKHLPLIFDPHQLFAHKLRYMEVTEGEIQLLAQGSASQLTQFADRTFTYLQVSSPDILTQLDGEVQGRVVVVECSSVAELSDRVLTKLTSLSGRVYLLVTSRMMGSCDLTNYCVINFSFASSDLTSHLHISIIQLERPEFIIRLRSVHNDLNLHDKQITTGQEKVLSTVRTATLPLSQSDRLMDLLVGVDKVVGVAQERIKEAKKLLREFNYQKISYFALAEFATLILDAANYLTHVHSYYDFSLQTLQSIISSIISKYGKKKLREGMAIQAHVMQMKQYLLIATYQHLSCQLFHDHHLFFSLLLSTKLLQYTGKVSCDEANLLLQLDTQQPSFTNTVLTLTGASPPAWMTRKAWAGVHHLHNHFPVFADLPDIINNSSEWQEYFTLEQPSLMGPAPYSTQQFSLFQRLILWKMIQPDQIIGAVKSFILQVLGTEFCQFPLVTPQQLLTQLGPFKLCLLMLPSSSRLATLDLTGLHQLADTVHVSVQCVSVHNVGILEQLLEELPSQADVWLVVTNLQLLSQPTLALDRLAKALPTSSRVFVTLPAELCTNLSPQLSGQVVRTAYHGVDMSTAISSQQPQIRKLYEEYPSDHTPINWLISDLTFAAHVLQHHNHSDISQWLLLLQDREQVTNSQYYPILTAGLTAPCTSVVQSLVSNLLATLPAPLTIHHSGGDVISQHLAEDLVQFNNLLQQDRCSLEELTTLLSGYCDVVDDQMLELLHDIISNKVPQGWSNPLNTLPVVMDLTTYMDVVHRKALFHQQWSPTSTIDLAMFSQIPVLMDMLKAQYCRDNGLPAKEACLSCQLLYTSTDQSGDGITLSAPQLSLITGQSSQPLAGVHLVGARCSDDHIKCPLILAHGLNTVHITTLLLATPRHVIPTQIVYKLF